jgi:hypothetical protein
VRSARLGCDDQALGARPGVVRAKDGDKAEADAGDHAHRLFELLRMNIPAGADNQILRAARHAGV